MELATLDVRDREVAGAVLEIQRRAYRIEAELIGSDAIPPLRETREDLQRCGERFLGAFVDGRLVGAVSWKLDRATIDLHRLVVDPDWFRRGVGTGLVRGALAANPHAERAVVETGALNEPARRFYEREGFELTGESEPTPGVRVARFTRDLDEVGEALAPVQPSPGDRAERPR